SRLSQSFEHLRLRLLRAELSGERPGVEQRPHARGDGALAFCILLAAQFSIDCRKQRMRNHLVIAPWFAGEGTVASLNGLCVTAKQVIRHAESSRRESVGWVRAKRTLQPRYRLPGSARPHQDGPAVGIVVGIAWIDLSRAVDFREREI